MSKETILEVTALNAGYGETMAVKNLSFTLSRGEILCLAGESGCGKSTVLKALIAADDVRYSGEARLLGTTLSTLSGKKRRAFCSEKMGMVFQSPGASFNPIRSYRKQFVETLKSHGKYDRTTFRDQAEKAFEKVELKDAERLLSQCPYALSGGMNQRMALALAMLLGQEILLCDEPTSALDATIALQVARELKRLRDVSGISQIVVTHNLAMAGFLADRIGIMYGGELVEMGETDQILAHPQHPYTKSLLAAVPRLGGELKELGTVPRGKETGDGWDASGEEGKR
ncbi:MAG: ABC transporter ATP-binding protein [Lachnospiraceae bacterium]|nr:ABC transporter ATP-binding protein [Lachnospiraceae bacterium]